MGQLERYGLYVLCVVIVGILGIAIWGGDPAAAGDYDAPEAHQLEFRKETAPPATAPPATPTRQEPFFETIQPSEDNLTMDLGAPAAGASSSALDDAETTLGGAKPAAPAPSKGPTEPASTPARANTARTYTVVKGDTMEAIAKRELGSARYVADIRKLNPKVRPERMQPGMVLMLPWIDSSTGEAEGAGRWTEYTVEKGDTIWDISVKAYGTGVHGKKIIDANGISQPTKLKPGTILRIPPVE